MIKELVNIRKSSEYQDREYHNVINEDMQKSRNGILEKEKTIHLNVDYRQKKIQVHLLFSEKIKDADAQLFCSSLKKIYMEKVKIEREENLHGKKESTDTSSGVFQTAVTQ